MFDNEITSFLREHSSEVLALTREITVIPAPSFGEAARSTFCLQWLHAHGCADAYTDPTGNVIWEYGNPDAPAVLFMAHLDTVFPAETPLTVTEQDGRLYCPGIGDNTVNLASLLLTASFFARMPAPQNIRLIFAANTCEEGLGNLIGCRALMDRFGNSLTEAIAYDLYFDSIKDQVVGSMRYRITVDTDGGHSFGNFGAPNAIAVMAALIGRLQAIPLPKEHVTTFNFGTISGGTTVNAIAAHCTLLYEFRSTHVSNLRYMDAQLHAILDEFAKDHRVSAKVVGLRPCAENVDPVKLEALCQRAEKAFVHAGLPHPARKPCATDCNLPMSRGIPAISLGLAWGGNAHRTDEYIEIRDAEKGLLLALRLAASYCETEPELIRT